MLRVYFIKSLRWAFPVEDTGDWLRLSLVLKLYTTVILLLLSELTKGPCCESMGLLPRRLWGEFPWAFGEGKLMYRQGTEVREENYIINLHFMLGTLLWGDGTSSQMLTGSSSPERLGGRNWCTANVPKFMITNYNSLNFMFQYIYIYNL